MIKSLYSFFFLVCAVRKNINFYLNSVCNSHVGMATKRHFHETHDRVLTMVAKCTI